MLQHTPDLFDPPAPAGCPALADAFETWATERADDGTLREASSVAVYRSMWGALVAWCGARGLTLQALQPEHLEAFLHARGGAAELTPRHAWRLLSLVDAVLAHHAARHGLPGNAAAHQLLQARPDWRYANAADKTPLPEHLRADEARRLVAWLLDPAPATAPTTAAPTAATALATNPALSWQSLRNRAAVGLQLGAGLTPSDIRVATLAGVVSEGGRAAGLPWKIRLPAHGGALAREAPIAPWAGRLLRLWMDARQALLLAGEVLFPATRSGRPWGKVAQYNAARAVLEAAGLQAGEGGSFKLRHTFALRQLQRGHAPEQVAQWMGLSDAAALARYRRVLPGPVDVA